MMFVNGAAERSAASLQVSTPEKAHVVSARSGHWTL